MNNIELKEYLVDAFKGLDNQTCDKEFDSSNFLMDIGYTNQNNEFILDKNVSVINKGLLELEFIARLVEKALTDDVIKHFDNKSVVKNYYYKK